MSPEVVNKIPELGQTNKSYTTKNIFDFTGLESLDLLLCEMIIQMDQL